ncbi:MAG: hypothetical protein U1F67_18910 [Rubrivivax sp.]
MDRTVVVTRKRRQQRADLEFWLAQPVEARIAAVEALRAKALAGSDAAVSDAESRLQRVCRVAPRARR